MLFNNSTSAFVPVNHVHREVSTPGSVLARAVSGVQTWTTALPVILERSAPMPEIRISCSMFEAECEILIRACQSEVREKGKAKKKEKGI